jgi:hypothetical protein
VPARRHVGCSRSSTVPVVRLVLHLSLLLVLVNIVETRGVDLVASHERQLARRAAKLFADELTVDDLPDGMLVRALR